MITILKAHLEARISKKGETVKDLVEAIGTKAFE